MLARKLDIPQYLIKCTYLYLLSAAKPPFVKIELPNHFGIANFPDRIGLKTLGIMYFLTLCFGPVLITMFSRRLSGSNS